MTMIRHAETIVVNGHVLQFDQALAQIEKGQQLAGHFPDAEALDRAKRILTGETTYEDAIAELDGIYGPTPS